MKSKENIVNISKKHDSSYRVIKILQLLNKKPMSIEELCFELDSEEQGVNKDTITKYFSTLREFGCIIEKSNHKFHLTHMPFFIGFEDEDAQTIAFLQKLSEKLYQKSVNQKLQSAAGKILKMMEPKLLEKYKKIYSKINIEDTYKAQATKIEMLSQYFAPNAQKLKIFYDNVWIRITPRCIKYARNKVYLYAYNEDTKVYRLFLIDKIEDVHHLTRLSSSSELAHTTTFKLLGPLANYYHLYEDEKVLHEEDGMKVISNRTQDRRELFCRLLKYGKYCEVITPFSDREKLAAVADGMISAFTLK